VFELMTITDELRSLIRENADAFRIRNLAISKGMRPLRQQVVAKIREGITTCDEMLRVTGSYSIESEHSEG
jgi:general secretion pathway protein E